MPAMSDPQILEILQHARTIALLGTSEKSNPQFHEVMIYLQQQGYRFIPVSPRLVGMQIVMDHSPKVKTPRLRAQS